MIAEGTGALDLRADRAGTRGYGAGPWPLYQAVVRELEGNLLGATRQPDPKGEPVQHWSAGVRTRIGPLRPLGRA